ncbi:MAG: DUF5615 family PIN-like protein [Nitrospinae bacterium]|nr:DUF5615 family PIN-like protein [Nitrospinota bacterium]
MSVQLYMDVHVRRAITEGLRLRGVDVLTAQDDGAIRLPDAELLDRATASGRGLLSQDEDLLRKAARRQHEGVPFAGVVYAHQLKVTIGQCVRDLDLIAHAGEPEDFANRVEYFATEVIGWWVVIRHAADILTHQVRHPADPERERSPDIYQTHDGLEVTLEPTTVALDIPISMSGGSAVG